MSLQDLPPEVTDLIAARCDDSSRELLRRTCAHLRDAVDRVGTTRIFKISDFLASASLVRWGAGRHLPLHATTFALAAKKADLSVLRELRKLRCGHDSRVCFHLARRGELRSLKWAKGENFAWNHLCCAVACEKDDLAILEWLREIVDCPCGGTYHAVSKKPGKTRFSKFSS